MRATKGRTLSNKVRDNVRQGRLIPAIVIDVFFDKATVKLSGNGSILHGLPVIGGPISAGQPVNIDFTTRQPTVVAQGIQGITKEDLEKALEALGADSLSSEFQLNIVLFSGGGITGVYTSTDDGLVSAIGDAVEGDVIWLSDVDISVSLEIPEGLTLVGVSNRQSILRGTITINPNVCLENLAIINASYTTNEVNAVIVQGSGDGSWIKGCEIHAYNCGEGLANAIKIGSSVILLQVTDSVVVGDSKDGANAHAFTGSGGTCKIMDCRLYSKSADHYNGTTFYEYSRVGHVSEIDRMCIPITSELYQTHRLLAQVDPFLSIPHMIYSNPEVLTVETKTIAITLFTVAQYENFVYFDITIGNTGDRILREYNLENGNTIDVTVWPYASGAPFSNNEFAAITGRELYVLEYDAAATNNTNIRRVNFETETSDIVYSFPTVQDEGDPETEIGYTYYNHLIIKAVKRANGDLFIVICGYKITYEGETEALDEIWTYSPVFWVMNHTQDGSWERYTGNPVIDPETESINPSPFGNLTTVVNSRYIVFTSDWQVQDGGAIIAVMSLDLDTFEIKEDHIFQYPSYGTFSPFPAEIAASTTDECAYIHYNGDFEITNIGFEVCYKYDPASGELSLHLRDTESSNWLLLRGRNGVYIRKIAASQYTIIDLSTLNELLTDEDTPVPEGSFTYSNFLNDNNEMMIYLASTGIIRLWNIENNGTEDMSTGAESITNGASTYPIILKDCYMIVSSKFVSAGLYDANRLLIRETP